MRTVEKSQDNIPVWLIGIVSLAVPVLVAFLFFFEGKLSLGDFVHLLPHFHGIINSMTAIVLVIAFVFIRKGKVEWHKRLMISAVFMGAVFLVSYVVYHSSAESVVYGDIDKDGVLNEIEKGQAPLRTAYLILLLSHILLSVFTLPVVLIAFIHGYKGNYDRHKKIVKWAFPMWLYVSVTGVTVYLMIQPYY